MMDAMQDRAERAERERDEERAGRQRAQADRDHFHARMERAERERDEAHTVIRKLLPDNIRLRETLNRAHSCSEWDDEMGWCEREHGHDGPHERLNGLGVALRWWADADADAEPERRSPHAGYKSRIEYRPGQAEPCTHWSGEHSPNDWGRCVECGGPAEYRDLDAAGGRPREADPQGPSIGTGDASVDGGGDDGRSRAEGAIVRSLCDRFGGGTPLLDSNIPVGDLARTAIDAALANGHVRLTDPGEPNVSVEAYWAVTDERDKAEARAREMERECRMLAQRLLAKDDTLTREERDRLISLKLGTRGADGA